MSTLSIANQAGSAGKSTTAVTLAALLAELGYSVRLIDLDAQSNASYHLGISQPALTSGDVLLNRATLAEAEIQTSVPGLTLVPASPQLDNDAVELARTLGGEQRLRLALEAANVVDVTIIDCPGALSVLTIAALVASDFAITVTQPTIKELEGIPKMEQTIADVSGAYNPKLRLGAIVPCIVPPATAGGLYGEAMQLLTDNYGELITPGARRSVRVPEAYSHQTPLTIHAPREPITDDYRAIAKALQDKGLLA
jgi:chromosome partitioning protein